MEKYKGYVIDMTTSIMRILVWYEDKIVHDCLHVPEAKKWVDTQC